MSGRKGGKFHEEYEEYDDEEEDKKCPPNLQVSRSNPNEEHKTEGAALVYEEEGEVTKQSSMESSDHEKAHREFAQKDEETIEMEEGVFSAEWEKINEATDGHVPISNSNERGVRNEAKTTAHGSSGGRHAASSPRGTDASPGADAVDGRANTTNNAQRRTCTLPPTRPGAERVPGPDYEGLDEDEDQMTFVSREETNIPMVTDAYCANTQREERPLFIPDEYVSPDVIREVSPDNRGRPWKLVGAFLLVIMIAIVIGAVLGSKGSRTGEEENLSPTLSPTMSPMGYEALLSNLSSDEGEALRNPFTPQYSAFNWTVTNTPDLAAYSIEQIIQRYALATLFFSTNGNSWNGNVGWLSKFEECLWHRVNCTSAGAVSELDLDRNYANGTLPPEIGLLSELEWLSLGSNELEGTIPSEVGQMTKLTYLDLSDNKLSGMIPTEIGMLLNLEELLLWNNALKGMIPSETGQLTKLAYLDLSDNEVSGTIPPEIDSLVNLDFLYLDGNNFTGNYTCPKSINYCGISCDDYSNDTCRSL